MISVPLHGRALEFIKKTEGEWGEDISKCDGMFFVGNLDMGHTAINRLCYLRGERACIPDRRMSTQARDLFLDIPDDVDPDRASVASVVATYRRSDGRWWVGVAFGDDAAHWMFTPGNLWDLAEEVCPL